MSPLKNINPSTSFSNFLHSTRQPGLKKKRQLFPLPGESPGERPAGAHGESQLQRAELLLRAQGDRRGAEAEAGDDGEQCEYVAWIFFFFFFFWGVHGVWKCFWKVFLGGSLTF